MTKIYDLAIIGGGVNGCGIARDATGRGLSVFLCEQGDLACATSSASTKLFHGGLRYLEYYKFRLVHESLVEREVLLRAMPHISWPLRFVLPYHKGLRPAWLLRLGLFIYDHLGGRHILPATKTLNLSQHRAGRALKPEFVKGFEYSDCWVQDSRLVMLNARDACQNGAEIRTRTRCISAKRDGQIWQVVVEDTKNGAKYTVQARVLVNASGPWVEKIIRQQINERPKAGVRLVRGSHIVVKKLFDHELAYIFQEANGRIIFALPYEEDFTLIGTTDEEHTGSLEDVSCTHKEVEYLCRSASEYFAKPVLPTDLVWSFSGVRPLYDDGVSSASEATRDYVLELTTIDNGAPLLSIFGGKITTHRKLSEAALKKLHPYFPNMGKPWTAGVALPGGDFKLSEVAALKAKLAADYPFLKEKTLRRYIRNYGTEVPEVLGKAGSVDQLGRNFGGDIRQVEVEWMMQNEFARTAQDVVWRRTKQGLCMTKSEIADLDVWMTEQVSPKSASRQSLRQ